MRLALLILTTFVVQAAPAPRVVATPPADAGRGLVRVSDTEIRHYAGKGATQYLRSLDNGETWALADLPASYPPATCLAKESPAIARNPNTGEFLRVEPLYRKKPGEGMYRSKGGLDGRWIRIEDEAGKPILPSGILRSPIWVNNNTRLLIPGHGGGCFTGFSDDDGASWSRSNVLQAPAHRIGGVHAGTRWNHGMVEATIVELRDTRLWMLARTAQDQHYESFSEDFGATWSPAKPSRFWGTITMPTLHRLRDGRLLFLWSNTTPLPEVKRDRQTRGEDVFTNRDSIHAAISDDDGETWQGFRELILDEYRNREDYGVTAGSNDRGKHQSEILQLDDNRILFSCGQHPLHRRLMIMDLRWLYERERASDLARDGARDWSTHQYIDKIVGHCGYNRRPGAQVRDGALRVLRVDDPTLTNPNQGATWNFPSAHRGSISVSLRLERDSPGLQIALTDRWFNPSDATVDRFASYLLQVDAEGRLSDGSPLLTPGKKHVLTLGWNGDVATVTVDGRPTGLTLPRLNDCPNGISYIHFYNSAIHPDPHGFSIFKTSFRASNHLKLFVLTGQSNSLGTTAGGEADPEPGADSADSQVRFFWHNVANEKTSLGDSGGVFTDLRSQQGGHYPGSATHWGPEFGFARAAYRSGFRDFGIIKASRGGGGNSHWSKAKGGHMYAHVVDTVKAATRVLKANGDSFEIAGLIYVQGESDSAAEAAMADARLAELVENLRQEFPEAAAMHTVIGGTAAGRTHATVRSKQTGLAAGDARISYVDNSDLRSQLYDRLHFDKAAKILVGQRIAAAFVRAGTWQPEFGKTVFIGDSITQGGLGFASYRHRVYTHLEATKADYQFVGSLRGAYDNKPVKQDFPNQHEGHWGWRAAWICGRTPLPANRRGKNRGSGTLSDWLTRYAPDSAVMMTGINDLADGTVPSQVCADIGSMIDQLRVANPQVRIYLSTLLPTNQGAEFRATVDACNGLLPALVAGKKTAFPTSPVWLIDTAIGFDPAKMTHDRVHPNQQGEAHVGDGIAAGLGLTPPR